jgi:hypothetical protein
VRQIYILTENKPSSWSTPSVLTLAVLFVVSKLKWVNLLKVTIKGHKPTNYRYRRWYAKHSVTVPHKFVYVKFTFSKRPSLKNIMIARNYFNLDLFNVWPPTDLTLQATCSIHTLALWRSVERISVWFYSLLVWPVPLHRHLGQVYSFTKANHIELSESATNIPS